METKNIDEVYRVAPSQEGKVVQLFPGAESVHPPQHQTPHGWYRRLLPVSCGGACHGTENCRDARLCRCQERGMATAEYAIATLAAVGFAGLLVVILRSDEVRGFLMTIIRNALNLG